MNQHRQTAHPINLKSENRNIDQHVYDSIEIENVGTTTSDGRIYYQPKQLPNDRCIKPHLTILLVVFSIILSVSVGVPVTIFITKQTVCSSNSIVSPCDSVTCQNDGTCGVVNGRSAKCCCKGDYSGEFCEVSPCSPNPCHNSGKCSVDVDGKAHCTCLGDWLGQDCNISPCVINPCGNGGTCIVDASGNVTCSCASDWSGDTCTVSPCDSVTCQNDGTCGVVNSRSAECCCKGDYSGEFCEVSPCSPNPCQNSGKCSVDVDGKAQCTCLGDWLGQDCNNNYLKLDMKLDSSTLYKDWYLSDDNTVLSNHKTQKATRSPDGAHQLQNYKGVIADVYVDKNIRIYYEVEYEYTLIINLSKYWLILELGLAELSKLDRFYFVGKANVSGWSFNVANNKDVNKVTLYADHKSLWEKNLIFSDNKANTKLKGKFGVFVDRIKNQFSLLNNGVHFYTFENVTSAEKLYPVFGVYNADKVKAQVQILSCFNFTGFPVL